MCGILGWVGQNTVEGAARFAAALDLLAHRGPDDRGLFALPGVLLGHRRLSIIDLSTAGHQPMIDPLSGAAIIFNGEIYNYVELRAVLQQKGHRFQTGTDTEVLLKAFLEWGATALTRLNGMWAFAIWLTQTNKLFFARDRFGVKPFYLRNGNGGFAFASEPKALLALFPEHRDADLITLHKFLAHGQLYTNSSSFFCGINILPPAHCGEYDLNTGELHIWRYWDYPQMLADPADDAEAAVEEFIALLDDSIRLRLRSDVPVGVTLSGGLDSTAVLAGSMKPGGSRVCFTSVYGANERGEAPWAKIAAGAYGIKPVEVEAPKERWLETLGKITWHMDAPGYSPAVYPLWYLMQEARRREVPVLLEGQGADEALGGYPQYAIIDFIQQCRHALAKPKTVRLCQLHNVWQGLVRTFTWRWTWLWLLRESFPPLIEINRRRVGAKSVLRPEFAAQGRVAENDTSMPVAPRTMDAVTARLWLDHSRNILPGLLHYGDAISMAHSIESRLPFMDFRLVEWLFMRHAGIKIHAGETKWVLREYLRRSGLAKIGNRADKLGYPTPVERWLAADNGALLKEVLLASGARLHEYCDPKKIGKLIQYHNEGKPGAGNHLYRLLSTEIWLHHCINS